MNQKNVCMGGHSITNIDPKDGNHGTFQAISVFIINLQVEPLFQGPKTIAALINYTCKSFIAIWFPCEMSAEIPYR